MPPRPVCRSVVLAAAALFAVTACNVQPAIRNRVTLDFSDSDVRRMQLNTLVELRTDPVGPAMHARLAAARDAIAAGRDEWTIRYDAAEPEATRVTIDRIRGRISRHETLATIDRDRLQRFFGDTSLSITLTRANGITELTIIPASSNRATREQRERVSATLESWSRDAARYVNEVGNLYRYLEANPQRAETAFRLMLEETGERSTVEEEQALIDAVIEAGGRILDRLDRREGGMTVDEEFDLVYNPFPAEIIVRTPRPFVANENFTRLGDDSVSVTRGGLLTAIDSLDEKWISPNPLAHLLHDEKPDIAALVGQTRRYSAGVTPAEIQRAVVERLRPASVYRLRWPE